MIISNENEIKQALLLILREVLMDPSINTLDETSIIELGIDSLIAVDLVQKINRHFSVNLKVDSIYQHPLFGELCAFIQTDQSVCNPRPKKLKLTIPKFDVHNPQFDLHPEINDTQAIKLENVDDAFLSPIIPSSPTPLGARGESPDIARSYESSENQQDIAIIGLGLKLPGANDIDDVWQIISRGETVFKSIPDSRWNEYPDDIYCQAGGFLDDYNKFNETFFGISPREAQSMDPQSRLLLEVAWHALEDAGVTGEIEGSETGVFIGNCFNDNAHKLKQDETIDYKYFTTGNSNSYLANRLSYHFDLLGPSLTIDTSCSSSMVALHYACQSLLTNESNMSLVGGTNLCLVPDKYRSFCEMKALSKSGTMKPFDNNADGYIPSEGVVVLILRRLNDAVKTNDRIYGVIKGTHVCASGRSGGATVPNAKQERAVMEKVWLKAGINAKQIQYMEAHGTATHIGDPLEFKAISSAIKTQTDQETICYIGSSKANFGHTEATSGLVGILKVLAQYKYEQITKLASFKKANELLIDGPTALIIPTENIPWPASSIPRLSGVNSFGMGGTLVHALLQDHNLKKTTPPSLFSYLFTFSAKSMEELTATLQNMLVYIENNLETISSYDLSYSLALKRSHYLCRLGLVANSLPELVKQIHTILSDDDNESSSLHVPIKNSPLSIFSIVRFQHDFQTYCEHVLASSDTTDSEYKSLLKALAELYVQGYSIPLAAIFPVTRQVLSLPKYPFRRQSEDEMLADREIFKMDDFELDKYLEQQVGSY